MNDLSLLNVPRPDVLKMPHYEEILDDLVAYIQKRIADYNPLESDDYMLLLEAFAYRELHLRKDFTHRLQSSLLLFAKGPDLDARAGDYGVLRLEGEKDDAFLQRILQSLGRFSTAGSKESYVYYAKGVSAKIDDVHVVSQAPGEVTVFVASFEGNLDDAIVQQVRNVLNDNKVRPITDSVTVVEAITKDFDIAIEVQLLDKKMAAKVESLIQENFRNPQKIGESLTVFTMIKYCQVPGVNNAIVPAAISPALGERLGVANISFTFT